jgi:hypothetical protein
MKFFIVAAMALLGLSSIEATSLQFGGNSPIVGADGRSVSCGDLPTVVVGSTTALPARHLFVLLQLGESARDLQVSSGDSVMIGRTSDPDPLADIPTSLDSDSSSNLKTICGSDLSMGTQIIHVVGEPNVDGRRYVELLVFPVTVNAQGEYWFHPSVSVAVANRQTLSITLANSSSFPNSATSGLTRSTEAVVSPEYAIITDSALSHSFQRLATYKNETGYRTAIVAIDSILESYSGVDDAEKLRNYLKDFHAAGGRYVLLGGDETIVPIRYAYHLSADSMPGLADLQICDLYFADLTGDWDRDHDGIYGERIQDAADIVPELMVGRLPFRNPDQVDRYIDKLIRYETDPGHGDLSYLTKGFFFSADQMRDWTPVAQHSRIASAYPSNFQIDTTNGIEAARGDDASPINLTPRQLRPVLTSGFGIINIIAHGRDDGFAVRTSGYNLNPKLYMISSPQNGESDCFDSTQAAGKPAFYYSLACNNAAFDYDQPPFNSLGICFSTNVLSETDGAVGFVGYSRWGWVGTSYLLQETFFDSLFAHPDRPAVAAMYESKAVFSYYRDLVYGQNYLGDPTLKVYCKTPEKLTVATHATSTGVNVDVTSADQAAAGAFVTVSAEGRIVARGITGGNGRATFDLTGAGTSWVITATLPGALEFRTTFSNAIVTGVNDSHGNTPKQFALMQNYPNPFNPTTRIQYSLPERSEVRIEIFNLLGRSVMTLVNEAIPAGDHEVIWNGTDRSGRAVATGVYFYRLTAGSYQQTRRMVLLK